MKNNLQGLLKMNLQLLASEDEPEEDIVDGVDDMGTNDKPDDDKDDKKYSGDDVNKVIERKFEEWKKQQQKEIDEAKKLADMNAQQKAEYERSKIQKELEELRSAKIISEMSKTARNMLSEKNISIEDDLLSVLVTKEAETTKSNVENFILMFEKAVEKAVNEKVKSSTPKRKTSARLTKEEILKIEDKKERRKKIAENLELFE